MRHLKHIHFEQMVDWIYPAELQLNKANTKAPFFDLNLFEFEYCEFTSIRENFIFANICKFDRLQIQHAHKMFSYIEFT